jgi:hypothetical protein
VLRITGPLCTFIGRVPGHYRPTLEVEIVPYSTALWHAATGVHPPHATTGYFNPKLYFWSQAVTSESQGNTSSCEATDVVANETGPACAGQPDGDAFGASGYGPYKSGALKVIVTVGLTGQQGDVHLSHALALVMEILSGKIHWATGRKRQADSLSPRWRRSGYLLWRCIVVPGEAERVLGDWYRRARESQFAHYTAASRYAILSRTLGIPSIALSAAAGTALFATLQRDTASFDLRLALGLVSVLAAVLAALQTFLGFGERADRHREAGSAYGSVRREIEQHRAVPPRTVESLDAVMTRLRGRLDTIAEKAPEVPDRSWNRARKKASQTSSSSQFDDSPAIS